MEAHLSSVPSSPANIEAGHENRNCGLLPTFSVSSLRNEIPERLLQDDASTLTPSYSESNTSARHNVLQQSAASPQEEPPLQKVPSQPEESRISRQQDIQDQQESVLESSTALFQELNHHEAVQDIQKPLTKPYSWKERLGTFAIVGLIAGSVLLCASVGTLAFIWFGSPAIPAWKEITARNWLSKAISICIGVIQQVMMLQLGIVTAALASLALESRDVVIGDVASVSAMRATATSTGAFVMAWQYLSGGSYRSARNPINILIIFFATSLWSLSQFFLLIILTDVSLRSTPGLASSTNLPYSLHYNLTTDTDSGVAIYSIQSRFKNPSAGPWNRKVSNYASFAEYSEPPYEADGVIDTGVTLRAFLPFGTAQDRENLKSYKGNSTVLDARVTCQVPQIKNATVDSEFRFRGSLAATRNTPRLANLSLFQGSGAQDPAAMGVNTDGSRDFKCAFTQRTGYKILEWEIWLCQLWKSDQTTPMKSFGGLYSEFQNPSLMGETYFRGSVYLVLNNTLGTSNYSWPRVLPDPGIAVAESSQERGEWLDLTYSNGSVIISASICYAAFDFADIEVSISSQSNRTESRFEPVFDQDTSVYTFHELRHSMGQDRSLPVDRRGILELAKRTWQVAPDGEDPSWQSYSAVNLRRTADLAFTRSALTGDHDYKASSTNGLLFQTGSCGGQGDTCVSPEEMHVSTQLW